MGELSTQVNMLEKLLQQFIDELELPPLTPKDEKQMFHLVLSPEYTVSLKQIDPGIFLHSNISPCPAEKKEDLFIYLMKANFLGLGTGGSSIGFDSEEKFLT